MIFTYSNSKPEWRGGRRFAVLFHTGRKWIKLLDTATLEVYRLPVAEQRRLSPYSIEPKTMASRLAKRRAGLKRHGLRFSRRAVKSAIQILRGI